MHTPILEHKCTLQCSQTSSERMGLALDTQIPTEFTFIVQKKRTHIYIYAGNCFPSFLDMYINKINFACTCFFKHWNTFSMNSSMECGTTFPPKFTMSYPKGSYGMGTTTHVSNKMERVSNLF